MIPHRSRNQYHPVVPLAFGLALLLPEVYRQVPRSTRHDWRIRQAKQLFGQELAGVFPALTTNHWLLRVNKTLIRILAIRKFIKHMQRLSGLSVSPACNHYKPGKTRCKKYRVSKNAVTDYNNRPAHVLKCNSSLVSYSSVHLDAALPTSVQMEDKSNAEQLRLIAQLNEKDKSTVMNIIDTMLTKQKFQEFFQQNVPQ